MLLFYYQQTILERLYLLTYRINNFGTLGTSARKHNWQSSGEKEENIELNIFLPYMEIFEYSYIDGK